MIQEYPNFTFNDIHRTQNMTSEEFKRFAQWLIKTVVELFPSMNTETVMWMIYFIEQVAEHEEYIHDPWEFYLDDTGTVIYSNIIEQIIHELVRVTEEIRVGERVASQGLFDFPKKNYTLLAKWDLNPTEKVHMISHIKFDLEILMCLKYLQKEYVDRQHLLLDIYGGTLRGRKLLERVVTKFHRSM
jgi:hypothetical protein